MFSDKNNQGFPHNQLRINFMVFLRYQSVKSRMTDDRMITRQLQLFISLVYLIGNEMSPYKKKVYNVK